MGNVMSAPPTIEQHRSQFRGRCAIALDWNAKITRSLANAIRISPMRGCTDLGAIEACREYIAQMSLWLDKAEESARGVAEFERQPEGPPMRQGPYPWREEGD